MGFPVVVIRTLRSVYVPTTPYGSGAKHDIGFISEDVHARKLSMWCSQGHFFILVKSL